jgi:uncharacterized membrane protein
MGLNEILDQNSSETSIFDATIAFYGATKTNPPQKTMTATRQQEQSAAVIKGSAWMQSINASLIIKLLPNPGGNDVSLDSLSFR